MFASGVFPHFPENFRGSDLRNILGDEYGNTSKTGHMPDSELCEGSAHTLCTERNKHHVARRSTYNSGKTIAVHDAVDREDGGDH